MNVETSLKTGNAAGLFALVTANVAVYLVLLQQQALFSGDWTQALKGLSAAVPPTLGMILTALLNAQLSAEAKARIIFLRWNNPLPGAQAFSKYAHSDPRVDVAALKKAYGSLPRSPRDQNALWYKMYKSVQSDPAVTQVHRAFLFMRDYACLSLFAVLVFGIAGVVQFASLQTALIYLSGLVAQFLLARRAASVHGRRFVCTVLALKSVS